MANRLEILLVSAALLGCSSANFAGSTNPKAPAILTPNPSNGPNSPNNPSPSPSDGPSVTPVPVPPGDCSAPLSIAAIDQRSVNSGQVSSNTSETLDFTAKVSGGCGNITLSANADNNSPNVQMLGARFVWRPGIGSGSSYQSEVGDHNVTITAKDEKGHSAQQTFVVHIKPISWVSTPSDTSQDNLNMVTTFSISETLHPSRAYAQVGTIDGSNLNTQHCVSFSGGAGIDLQAAPSFVSKDAKTVVQTFQYSKDAQHALGMSDIALVTYVNLAPNPSTSLSSESGVPAPSIRIISAFSRCIDTDANLSVDDCKKQTASDGPSHYFYCSEYSASNLTATYCKLAALAGVTGQGC